MWLEIGIRAMSCRTEPLEDTVFYSAWFVASCYTYLRIMVLSAGGSLHMIYKRIFVIGAILLFCLALCVLLTGCGREQAPGVNNNGSATGQPGQTSQPDQPGQVGQPDEPDQPSSNTVTEAGGNVKEDKTATLRFDSFDGGGPEFQAILDDPSLVSSEEKKVYSRGDHEEIDGAGFTVVFTFTGQKSGETKLKVEERSPIAGNADYEYSVKVDGDLRVTIEQLAVTDPNEVIDLDEVVEPSAVLVIDCGGRIFYADFVDNPSAEAFRDELSHGAIELEMQDYGGFEKVGPLPWKLPETNERITTEPGDIILYQGDKISLYYDENTWELTRLARIGYISKDELLKALGEGGATVSFSVEWSE